MGAIDRTDLEWKTTSRREFLEAVGQKEIWCYPETDCAVPLDPEWRDQAIKDWSSRPDDLVRWSVEGDRIYFWLPFA